MRRFELKGTRHGEVLERCVRADNWHEAIRRGFREHRFSAIGACVLIPA